MGIDEARRRAKPRTAHDDVVGIRLQTRADLSRRPDREQPIPLDHDRGIADHAIHGVDRQREVETLNKRARHGTGMDSPRFRNRP